MYRFPQSHFIKLAAAEILALEAPEIARQIWSFGRRGWRVVSGNGQSDRERELADKRLQKGMERRNIAFDHNVGDFVPRNQIGA